MSASSASPSVPTAIVVGANFAGLAATLALRHAGFAVTAYERAPSLAVLQGAKGGVHMWPNALRALRVLGAADAVLAAAVPITATMTLTSHGRVLADWRLDELERETGDPTVLVQRTDLHRALTDALAGDAIRTGMRCIGFEQHPDGVTARFENGETVRADVLVGADGAKSAVRTQLLGPTAFRPGGGPMVRGEARLAEDTPVGVRTSRIYIGEGYQFGVNRLDEDRYTWFLRTHRGVRAPVDAADLARLLGGWADPVGRIAAATAPGAFFQVEIADAEPSLKWGEGRVTLAGDAAHPMLNALSQGAAQAFEDGAVLQLELGERGTADLPAALRAYEARRIPRASAFVKRSRAMGDMLVWRNRWACAARTGMMLVNSGGAWKRIRDSTAASF